MAAKQTWTDWFRLRHFFRQHCNLPWVNRAGGREMVGWISLENDLMARHGQTAPAEIQSRIFVIVAASKGSRFRGI